MSDDSPASASTPEVAPTASGLLTHLRQWWKSGWLFALFLVVATLAAYQTVWHAGFIWDDDSFLTDNPLIHAADGLRQFWFTTTAPDYFPVTSTFLWLEWRWWGENPLGYHLVNVLLHAISSVLLWRALLRLQVPGARLAAALFALHPVNVETVAWITEHKNTLAMLFCAASLLAYLRSEDNAGKHWYWLGVAAFALALLSKTAVAPLPLALLVVAWWRRGRVTGRDVWRSLPFFLLAALLAVVTIWFQYHRAIGSQVVREDGFLSRLAVAGWALWFYLWKAVAPFRLMFVYPRWRTEGLRLWSFVPVMLWLAGLGLCWRCRNRPGGRALMFAMVCYTVMLLPALGFLNIYFMKYSLVADHWQYFGLIAPLALAAAGITRSLATWLPGKARLAEGTLSIALVAALGVLTWRQSADYRHSETLWRATLARDPNSGLAHLALGKTLAEKGSKEEAIEHLQKALDFWSSAPDLAYDIGNTLLRRGWAADAVKYYQTTLHQRSADIDAHLNLGSALFQLSRVDEAITEFQRALTLRPGFPGAVNNLACVAWSLATSPNPAMRDPRRAVSLAEDLDRLSGGTNASVLRVLAAGYGQAGRFTDAGAAARRGLELALKAADASLVKALHRQVQFYQPGASTPPPPSSPAPNLNPNPNPPSPPQP